MRALLFLGVGLVAIGGSIIYTLFFNPEVRLYRHAGELKEKWSAQLGTAPKYVVFGGSSCATTIQPRRLLAKDGLRVANFGLQAGMGAEVLTRYALRQCRRGDILLVALEPGLLIGSVGPTSLGKQFAIATGHADLLSHATLDDSLGNWLSLRPGAYHFFTLLGKVASRKPLYRYGVEDFDVSGYQRVTVRRDFASPEIIALHLSGEARALMQWLSSACANSGVGLLYTLPWGYSPPAQLRARQLNNLDFLAEIVDYMPVLRDKTLGAWPIRADYADTDLHLTPAGARKRTDALGAALKTNATWSGPDLKRLRNSLP